MSEAAATTPPAATTDRPLGNQRGVGITIVLAILTLWIYVIVWQWKTFNEVRNYRGRGVGGFAGFLLCFVVSIPIWLLPSYVGKL